MQIVTLLSDFGSRDQYVAQMKGTILTICPSATLVDITHEIEKFNVRIGAFVLAAASRYFPTGTIHLAVVDPGVGGPRRGLAIESRRSMYVGPDNGLLIPAALRDGVKEVYSIENPCFMRSTVSPTFHGRDVFAYAAGRIACGARLSEVGPMIRDPVPAAFPEAAVSPGRIDSEVLAIDSFGNVVTTASEKDLAVAGFKTGTKVGTEVKRRVRRLDLVRTYSDAADGETVLLIGSHGFLEVACNRGSAAQRLRVRSGDKINFKNGRGYRS